jgi:hypothetical protein
VSAEHHHHCALFSRGGCDGVDHRAEIAGDQNIGQRFQESSEAPILARRRSEFGGGNLVGTALDRNGADFRQIDFRGRGSRALFLRNGAFAARAAASVTAQVLGDGKKDLR